MRLLYEFKSFDRMHRCKLWWLYSLEDCFGNNIGIELRCIACLSQSKKKPPSRSGVMYSRLRVLVDGSGAHTYFTRRASNPPSLYSNLLIP